MENDKVYESRNFRRGWKEPNPKTKCHHLASLMLFYFILIIDLAPSSNVIMLMSPIKARDKSACPALRSIHIHGLGFGSFGKL